MWFSINLRPISHSFVYSLCIFKNLQSIFGLWISLMLWPALVSKCSGYLAPEYAMGGQLTMKADVYSFGVLILEIISGKSSARTNWGGSNKFLLEWVCNFQLPIYMYTTYVFILLNVGLVPDIMILIFSITGLATVWRGETVGACGSRHGWIPRERGNKVHEGCIFLHTSSSK